MDTSRKLTRSADNRMIGGVAAGIARYFNVSATLVRIGFVALAFAGGFGLAAYAVCWLSMPREYSIVVRFTDEDDIAPARGSLLGGLFKAALLFIAACMVVAMASEADGGGPDEFWFVAFIGGLAVGLYYLVRSLLASRGTSNGRLHRSSTNRRFLGVFGGLAETFGIDVTLLRIAAVVLTVIGFGSLIPLYILYAIIIPRTRFDSGSEVRVVIG